MKYVRVTSRRNGKLLAEHLYMGDSHANALVKFFDEYPEHRELFVMAKTYESDAPENKEHFLVCQRCGCVH